MSTSSIPYLILVIDFRPSVQKHLRDEGMSFIYGQYKGRVPFLQYHIHIHCYKLLPLLIHIQVHVQLLYILPYSCD